MDHKDRFCPPLVSNTKSASGLVVKSIVAIDGPRVRFAAGAFLFLFFSLIRLRARAIPVFCFLLFHFVFAPGRHSSVVSDACEKLYFVMLTFPQLLMSTSDEVLLSS